MSKKVKKVLGAEAIRARAEEEYAAGTALPEAIRKLDAEANRPTIALVSRVYWRAKGLADPIRAKGEGKAFDAALAKRRKSGIRFEVLAASAEATLGRPVSTEEVRKRLDRAGLAPDASYTGRGTRRSRSGEATRVEAGL